MSTPDRHRPESSDQTGYRRQPKLKKASDVLAEQLRARILGETLRPGDAIPSEAELISGEGYSRGTVREALRLLEADGLIEIRRGPQGGVRVARPDLTRVATSLALLLTLAETTTRAFFEFRKLVEPAAAAAAARNATEDERKWLIAVAERTEQHRAAWEPALDFHEAISICSHNDLFRFVIAALSQELTWHLEGERLGPEHYAHTQKAHVRIARAIAAQKAQEAEHTMLRHLQQFERVLETQGRLDQPLIPRQRWLSQS